MSSFRGRRVLLRLPETSFLPFHCWFISEHYNGAKAQDREEEQNGGVPRARRERLRATAAQDPLKKQSLYLSLVLWVFWWRVRHFFSEALNPLGTPKPLPTLIPSKFVPKNGILPVVKALI